MVILSRSFCATSGEINLDYTKERFEVGVNCLRAFEKEIAVHSVYFTENEQAISEYVEHIVNGDRIGA